MIRQAHLMAVVGAFLMGCAVLLSVGCARVGSEAPEGEQGSTEATKEEQGRSSEAAFDDERCAETRTIDLLKSAGVVTVMDLPVQPGDPEARYVTNDLPGCPNGGLLSGTENSDNLAGEDGEDEVRGLGAADTLSGGSGSDVLYGGPGDDELQAGAGLPGAEPFYDTSKNALHGGPGRDWLSGAEGDDVLYGGEGDDVNLWGDGGQDVLYGGGGNDLLDDSDDGHRDKLYCGEGKDDYFADKIDYVDSSCEVKR